ncbi:MAG: peroxiredoxin [Thermoplasmata archaeon]
MVAVGEKAPDFEAKLQDGRSFRFSSTQGRPRILYFYPKADTPGCTIEAKGFRDRHAEFQARGVTIVGVSTDTCADQLAFAKKYGLPFSLVADETKAVARAYGVLGPSGHARRVSFFVAPDGTVEEVVDASAADTHLARAAARYLRA